MSKKKNRRNPSRLLQFLILGGVLILAIAIIAFKDRAQPEVPMSTSALPEMQLERALNAGKPTLAFFHSNSCEQCIIMIETVEQVYPEFRDSVELVDINVYDQYNEPLMEKVGLQYIPTLMFYDKQGQDKTFVGVMAAETLREYLVSLIGVE